MNTCIHTDRTFTTSSLLRASSVSFQLLSWASACSLAIRFCHFFSRKRKNKKKQTNHHRWRCTRSQNYMKARPITWTSVLPCARLQLRVMSSFRSADRIKVDRSSFVRTGLRCEINVDRIWFVEPVIFRFHGKRTELTESRRENRM